MASLTHYLLRISLISFGLIFVTVNQYASAASESILHYAYFGKDRHRLTKHLFLTSPQFYGAQIMYSWRDLEPKKDHYDFSKISQDVLYLKKFNKKLFLQIQDATFMATTKAVPNYILKNPQYNGGASAQYNKKGQLKGWVARRWDPNVQKRFHKLLFELGKNFDGIIAGVNLQETAELLSEDHHTPQGFTYESYKAGIIANMNTLDKAFAQSLKMQYANFMPGEWLPWKDKSLLRAIYMQAKILNIAIGAPDLMPTRKGHRNHAHRFMKEFKNQISFAIAVQDGNYHGDTGNTELPRGELPNLVPELYKYAKEDLNVKIIFWGIQEPYFYEQVMPFLKD